jgi:heme/copper-type cytochrome/quinol oxidase subunit 3
MSDDSLVFLPTREPPVRKKPVIASPVLAMLMFTGTEIMLFAGLISSITILRNSVAVWPPPGQPRLPVEETAINTAALLLSGIFLIVAHRRFKEEPRQALGAMITALVFGAFFVVLQGREWVDLLASGLTLTSSTHGSFFYLIIGMHALHALIGVGVLGMGCWLVKKERLSFGAFGAIQVFWYFVVGMWPILYLRVYF